MADIKWSAFPSVGDLEPGDIIVGLRSGANVQFAAPVFGNDVVVVTGATQAMTANVAYIANRGTLITFSLPTSSVVGDKISVVGQGAGGWTIHQAASQQIQIGDVASTVGTGGSVASSNQWDSLTLICITANDVWTAFGGWVGNLTYV